MLSWAGKVGVVISLFYFCIELCECKLPVIITAVESAFAVISYIIVATTRKTGLFYRDFRLVKEEGLTILEYTEGPWYMLWNITIVVVIVTCMWMLIKAI